MIVLAAVSEAKKWEHSTAEVVVVCDPDPHLATEVSSGLTDVRTAIFIGDLNSESDRSQALEFVCEIFNVGTNEVLIAFPVNSPP